jgi:hypothetical protein
MNRLSYSRTIQIIILVALLLFQNPSSLSARYNPSRISNHLVETFGSLVILGQVMPLRQLEKSFNYRVDGIYYIVDTLHESRPILINEYGRMRWQYLKQKLSIGHSGLLLNIVDDRYNTAGRGKGSTTEEEQKSLIKEISSMINKSKSKSQIAEKSAQISYSEEQNEYQVAFLINWENPPEEETISRCKYLLFLVADELFCEGFACLEDQTFENVAYDFIPLEGDDPKEFDGSGFLLNSPNREISSECAAMTLTTVPFKLPEMENINWSLHMIIEDPENLGNEVFSYKVKLHNN